MKRHVIRWSSLSIATEIFERKKNHVSHWNRIDRSIFEEGLFAYFSSQNTSALLYMFHVLVKCFLSTLWRSWFGCIPVRIHLLTICRYRVRDCVEGHKIVTFTVHFSAAISLVVQCVKSIRSLLLQYPPVYPDFQDFVDHTCPSEAPKAVLHALIGKLTLNP